MTAAEIYLPCEVGQVRVKLGFGDSLSPLEETVLKVIAAAATDEGSERLAIDIWQLAGLLGIGHRVVLDLVHDLWRAGHVVVDFSSNTIRPSPETKALADVGRLAELAGVETEDRSVELMVERLTGFVMPVGGRRAPADPRLAIRFVAAELSLADAGQAEVIQAIRTWLRQRNEPARSDDADGEVPAPRARERRILSVRTAKRDREGGSELRWYRLDVQAAISEATGRLMITVVDRRFPADRRELASDRLTRLAEEFPRETFAVRLRAMAEERLVAPPPLEQIIEDLSARVAEGETVPAGKRRFEHLDWIEDAKRIEGMIDDRIAHEADSELVIGGEQNAKVVSQLINEAQTQVVIVCPWVTYKALERVTAELRAASDRGVQVVIIWGIGHQGSLSDNVRNALDSLIRRARIAPVLRPQVSANTHAKLVICDDRAALITSRNVLSATRDRLEAGLLLRVPEAVDGMAIREMLGWARVNMPGAHSRSVFHRADQFDRKAATPRPIPRAKDQNFPDQPTEDADRPDAIRAWRLTWEEHVAALRRRLATRPRPAARLVEDGANRELLWFALGAASRRVVIASGQITDEVVSDRMTSAIGDLLARGIAVTIGYDGHSGADRGQAAVNSLSELSIAHPGLLTLNAANGHSKVLIWDDDVVVGSFNYLSFSGYGSSGGRHLMRSELGIRLTDGRLADSLASACGEPAEVTAQVSGTVARVAVPPLAIGAAAAARRIVGSASDQRSGLAVRAELEQADNPWRVLDALDRVASPTVLRSAISFCLAYHADRVSAEVAAQWRRRLVDELVKAGDFMEAAILLDQDSVDRAGPFTAVVTALANRTLPHGEMALFDAVMQEDLTADQRAALLAVAISDLLEVGTGTARDVVVELAPTAADSWQDLARLTLKYHEHAAGASTAELMRDISGQRQLTERLDGAWTRLELAIQVADSVPANLDGAKKTHAALFNDNALFGRIGGIATRRDLAALRAVTDEPFQSHDRADELAGRILDSTWVAVAPRNGLLIGKSRAKYVKRLAEVISAVRSLLTPTGTVDGDSEPGPGMTSDPHPELREAAAKFADGYRELRPRLLCHGPLAGPAVEAVLADLDQLIAGQAPADGGSGGSAEGNGVLPYWPGRWQYPDLTVALSGEPEPSEHVADLLLRGLVDPMPAMLTAGQLVKAGEFGAAEELRERAGLTAHDGTALLSELKEAQASARTRLRYEADALTRRARRAEIEFVIDLEALDEQTERSATEAEAAITRLIPGIEAAEDTLSRQLSQAAEEKLAEIFVAEDLATSWREGVQACLEAREFAAARQLLAHDPREAPLTDPWTVPPLRPTWPFSEGSAETTISWYFDDAARSPVGFTSWRPGPNDTAAWALLKALREHLCGRPGDQTATGLCDALQHVTGGHQPANKATADGYGWNGRIYLPDSMRLPPTAVLGREGIAVWLAGPAHPPPDHDADPVLWLVTDFGRPAAPRTGTMLVDLPFLLRLAAPVPEDAGHEARLVNLARHLGRQLSPEMVLEGARTSFGEPHVAPFSEPHVVWLLHLLGVAGDGVVAEAIHHESGGRRELLIPLLAELLAPPVAGQERYQSIDIAALNAVRQSGVWRAEALKRLLAPLASDPAAPMVLKVAAAFEHGRFLLDDIRAGVRVVVPADQANTVLASTDVHDAAQRLRRSGLFESASDGRWRLPVNGTRDLLSTEWPGYSPLTEAKTAIEAEFARHQLAAVRIRAELSDDIVRVIGHYITNQQAAARSAKARGEIELAWEILENVGSVHQMYTQAIGPVAVIALSEVITDQLNGTEYLNPKVRTSYDGDDSLLVVANRWLLGQAFKNLFDNTRRAIDDTHRNFGDLRVTVISGPPGPDGEPRCRIDIEDSGGGIQRRSREKFALGEVSSDHGSGGTGLLTARLWLERYRGTLTIVDGPSTLGGAHIQVTLPLAQAVGSA